MRPSHRVVYHLCDLIPGDVTMLPGYMTSSPGYMT